MLETFQGIWRGINKFFWTESFWLPFHLTWEDVKPTPENGFPEFWDVIIYPFMVAAFLLFLRYFFIKRYIFFPLAKYYGLKMARSRPPPQNKELEKVYEAYNGEVPDDIKKTSARFLGISERDVDRWIRQKIKSDKHSVGEKFAECGFVFTYHTFYNLMGLFVLYDKHWFWDIAYCYKDYPAPVEQDIWYYYMIGLGFYISQTIHQTSQPPHKETPKIYLHHFFTIVLLVFSWTSNLVRIGSIVYFIHEAVECFHLGAKLAKYTGNELATSIFFAITAFVWIVTRIFLFAFWAIWSTIVEAPKVSFMPAAYLFYFCLFVLLGLNLMWTGTIITIIYRAVKFGNLEDARSEIETEDEEETQKQK